ncbi:HAD family hydrolase, partial [Paraburkholderia hospita]
VGHLPRPARRDGSLARLPGTGRPHYVDSRIRSLKSLRLGIRPGRPIEPLTEHPAWR